MVVRSEKLTKNYAIHLNITRRANEGHVF